jgi:hypothetical protein
VFAYRCAPYSSIYFGGVFLNFIGALSDLKTGGVQEMGALS